jgi:excisionase family DNA binding protein
MAQCPSFGVIVRIAVRGDNEMKLREAQEKLKQQFLGVKEAEQLTGISRWTWRKWAYDGRVASVKLGKRLLIPLKDIERLVEENTRPRLSDAQ